MKSIQFLASQTTKWVFGAAEIAEKCQLLAHLEQHPYNVLFIVMYCTTDCTEDSQLDRGCKPE